MSTGIPSPSNQRAALAAAAALLLAWIAGWMAKLGPALINDEYAAIDYFYRVVRDGKFFPTPDKLHKPLSLLTAVFAWVSESPLGYEAAIAVFASAMVPLLFLLARRELGFATAVIAGAALLIHPDLVYYSVTGSTIIPFTALAFAALLAAVHRKERPAMLWVYAWCFLAAGLYRPESWLFAAPAIVWWWPGQDRKKWTRLITALAIIGLGPVIWFGKDYFINGSVFHSMIVATRDKAIGTGAGFGPLFTTKLFFMRLPERVSAPVAAAGLIGMLLFIKDRGWRRGILHPLAVAPFLVGAYVWLIVLGGVFPVQRYWFFDAVFAIMFSAYLIVRLARGIELTGIEIIQVGATLAAVIAAAALFALQPESSPPDLRWLMAAAALAALIAASFLIGPRIVAHKLKTTLRLAGIAAIALAYFSYLSSLAARQLTELELESKVQAEIAAAAQFLMDRIPEGAPDRIMIPSRRNEQLNWLFRNREIPDTVTFREGFYLQWSCEHPAQSKYPRDEVRRAACEKIRAREFLALHPDWIVYVPEDFQFYGVEEEYGWLGKQDHTTLYDTKIGLVLSTGVVRVFHVTYPPGAPPKEPLPPMP